MEKLTDPQKELLEAIRACDLSRVKFLIQKKKISPNFGYEASIMDNPIVVASLKDDFTMAVWLIEEGNAVVTDDVKRFVINVVENISVANYIEKSNIK